MGRISPNDFEGSERFAIESRLGEGAFGVVYRAHDKLYDRRVALKTLRRFDSDALLRFKKEFRSLADINHHNLITFDELLSENDEWFFTMELIEGKNLLDSVRIDSGDSEIKTAFGFSTLSSEHYTDEDLQTQTVMREEPTRRPYDEQRLRNLFGQLVEGVMALHSHKMLHRDLKPSNVLVDRDDRVVVLDFGLVADIGGLDATQSGKIVGTPAFMSPEQGAGEAITEASDWYSVGVMLFQALTGRLPFDGNLRQLLRDKSDSEAPSPGNMAAGVPADLDDLCRRLLCPRPAGRPSGEEVLTRLGRVKRFVPASAAKPSGGPLVGRKQHLHELHSAFAEVRAGNGVTVYIRGRSGMGKTALAHRFLSELKDGYKDVVLLAGRCYERESVPYKALDSLVDVLSQYLRGLPHVELARVMPRDWPALVRLFPVLGQITDPVPSSRRSSHVPSANEFRRRAFAAFRELLSRISDAAPLVVFIDDLQWGDIDSGGLLNDLMRPPRPPAILLMASYRSEDASSSSLLEMLLGEAQEQSGGDVRDLEVSGLSPDDAEELANSVLGEDEATLALAVARESGGSPFFVRELARHRAAGDVEEISLESVIQRRVERLEPSAKLLLQTIAVAGRPADTDVLIRASEIEADSRRAIHLLRTEHLIRSRSAPGRSQVETYHDRIREAVVAGLDADFLSSCHGRLAARWEESGLADPETLAFHYNESGDQEKAATHSLAAAELAGETLAFARAARLYQMVLDLKPLPEQEAHSLKVKLADALANAGRGPDAGDTYLEAALGTTGKAALEMRRMAGWQFLISGHIDKGLEVFRSVLGEVGVQLASTPQRALVGFVFRRLQLRLRGLEFTERSEAEIPDEVITQIDTCWSISTGLGLVDAIRGAHFQVRHLLLALQAGEPYRVARALAMEAGYSTTRGGHNRARTEELLRRIESLADRVANPHASGLAQLQTGVAASLHGDFRKSYESCRRAEAILRGKCSGVIWELDMSLLFRLHALFWLGDWKELSTRLPVFLNEAQERSDLFLSTYIRVRSFYTVYLARDEPERAVEEQEKGIAAWSQKGFHTQHYWDWFARGEIDLYASRPQETLDRLRARWGEFRRSLLPRFQAIFIEVHFLRARAAVAAAGTALEPERKRLLRGAEKDLREIEKENMPWGNALALLGRAGVATTRRDTRLASELVTGAQKALEASEMGLLAAAAQWRRGELLGTTNGAAHIEAGRSWMEQEGIRNPERLRNMLAPGSWSSSAAG